jgi:hypothetical protein
VCKKEILAAFAHIHLPKVTTVGAILFGALPVRARSQYLEWREQLQKRVREKWKADIAECVYNKNDPEYIRTAPEDRVPLPDVRNMSLATLLKTQHGRETLHPVAGLFVILDTPVDFLHWLPAGSARHGGVEHTECTQGGKLVKTASVEDFFGVCLDNLLANTNEEKTGAGESVYDDIVAEAAELVASGTCYDNAAFAGWTHRDGDPAKDAELRRLCGTD